MRRILLFILLVALSAVTPLTNTNVPHAGTNTPPREPPDPRLAAHLRLVAHPLDKKRLAEFYRGGTGREITVTAAQLEQAITTGMRSLGRPYSFGRLDCSSFVHGSLLAAGISLPRAAEEQARYGRIIPDRADLRRGDLIFFTRTYRTGYFITHVAFCLGDNRMLHAASDIVRINDFPERAYWWKDYFIFGTRLLAGEEKK